MGLTRRRPRTRLLALLGSAAVFVLAVVLAGGGDSRRPLRWAPPSLDDPITVELSPARAHVVLDPRRDYRLRLPDRALEVAGGVQITGGHDVVLVGGEIRIPRLGADPTPEQRHALLLKDQTGTVHIEGLKLGGPDLADAIDLDQRRGATVQLQNIRVEGTHARDMTSFSDVHPDVVQSWAGPHVLRIDGLTATTAYQGIFLQPTEYGSSPRSIEISRVNLRTDPTARYLLWLDPRSALALRDVWFAPPAERPTADTLWPDVATWRGARRGQPPGGDFVPEGAAGVSYR